MNFLEAIREVENIGGAYFYDEVDRYTDQEIVADIQRDIQGTQQKGLNHWIKIRDALQVVLDQCSEEDLRKLILSFGHPTYDIEKTQRLFTQLHEVIKKTIEERTMLS